MTNYKFDVVIIGAGPAGAAAAGALAGTGISVALLETAVYAGAENWSGCVYFTESLAAQDCFGSQAVAAAPFERRVTRRGTLMHNGLDVIGVHLNDAQAFQNCYTVLRPVYDPYFANLARLKGAVHITGTTVTSLIRNNGRVIGVDTNRGHLFADVTFIAEGDASHLVRSEQFERVQQPHFLQGVKAVLSLSPAEIEKRFMLNHDDGAAYEILLRNPAIAGRTAKLNIGGFLYTNRDSISIGYVAPLGNIRDNFRGNHDALYEWMCGLPFIKELIQGASLSAYGTKIIRSGGWHERPILVQDGVVVGGAATGLGIDLPFPNFTGPASASGLYFARAVKSIQKRGSVFDAKQLTKDYLTPLQESVYGRNAEYLSQWPGYFGKSSVLFNRTIDMACGTAHFLSTTGHLDTGRFLRSHLLSFKGMREFCTDTIRAIGSLRLWKPIMITVVNPATIGRWCLNLIRTTPATDTRLGIILRIKGKSIDPQNLAWPINSFLKRLSPGILLALQEVYANDGQPLSDKFLNAVRHVLQSFSLADLFLLPAYALTLVVISAGTAATDAFRFYILKIPLEKFLAAPDRTYAETQRKARNLDLVKPAKSLEAKLATNTYRVGSESHIRTVWPETIQDQPEMAQAGLWWICPAKVYIYDAPAFAGRGRVTVNYENCIKCESCWRAEPARALWGRHTDHQLIYRPESSAISRLLQLLENSSSGAPVLRAPIARGEKRSRSLTKGIADACRAVLNASFAFRDSVGKLPHSPDKARLLWPLSLGKRLDEKLVKLGSALANDGSREQTDIIRSERSALHVRLAEGRFFHALYCSRRIEELIHSWISNAEEHGLKEDAQISQAEETCKTNLPMTHEQASALFPDRIVKQWEESSIPETWCEKLTAVIFKHRDFQGDLVRVLSSINPALGLVAAHHLTAARLMKQAKIAPEPGVCAVDGSSLAIQESSSGISIKGRLKLVPAAACNTILVLAENKGYLIPATKAGVTITPTPAIGFRAAGLSAIEFDCSLQQKPLTVADPATVPDACSYLAIALGAADYLAVRVKDHALGRVQFPGQMLDTEGRDGIAKLGAVKALIARTEAWRLLLQRVFALASHSAFRGPNSAFPLDLLCSVLAAKAFGPEPGTMGYDAGQVFGGFAYSEDDLLSRSYRDSSIFRFLSPGYGAAARLNSALTADQLDRALQELDRVQGEPLEPLASRLRSITKKCTELPDHAEKTLIGETTALILGISGLLVSIEEDLNNGVSNEAGSAAVDVLLGEAEDGVMKAALSAGLGSVSPSAVFPVDPAGIQSSAGTDYEAFCNLPGKPHQSGGFLTTLFDRSPRFVPEMQLDDANLKTRWGELVAWFRQNCSEKSFYGLHIERYIEKNHRLPEEIIEAAKERRWLATYIPQSLGGLGWHKAEYYILNSAAGSFGDASIDLLIMASTSIGTTPILLGLQEELPRVRAELAPLAQDERRLGEIQSRLGGIIRTLSNPNPGWIKKEYEAVMKLVDDRIRRTRVVKYLAANFLKVFYGAGMAGRRGDFSGFIANLKHADDLLGKLMPDVRSALEELPRRERCHQLFLRYLGHGAVSAFALTEPTAGSDSGGVKTTAKLLSVGLTQLKDGRYSFSVDGNETVRYLIDADKILFTDQGLAYETPDGQQLPIRYDKYDYRTDKGSRYFIHKDRECPFHDIGQVRRTNDGLRFEYYSLTGAKMWITNGSIATQFCLYAQTPEGVTGFMVDRHSEGFKVGADEKKTGQRGSPTNEISIDNMRVPREAVIGYEGHGQVNALETLNVGRCGLAVVSGALMRKLMLEANALIPASPERDLLLGEAAAVLFGSESLAYYLVGLFDRPHESVRMESAIAKYLCSEDLHDLITLVEQAFGPDGQTEKYLVEKARRDSRILTIYEGTNEVQRFLILKDLVAQAPTWPEFSEHQGQEADRTLAFWKNRLRKHVQGAAAAFGDTSWSDAMLQPALFPLSEMAGEILRLECLYYRMEWLGSRNEQFGIAIPDYGTKMQAAGNRAIERSIARLTHQEKKFLQGWGKMKRNLNMPEVVLADAALDALSRKAEVSTGSAPALSAPLRVLSIIRPVADLSPRPRLEKGEIRELVWRINPSDLAALSQVLAIKAGSRNTFSMDVLMPGGYEQESLLRMTTGGRADTLHRIAVALPGAPSDFIHSIKNLEALRQYDLITIGAECLDGDRDLGTYLAGRLNRRHYRRDGFAVDPDGSAPARLALPAVLSITGSVCSPDLNMDEAVTASFSPVHHFIPEQNPGGRGRFQLPAGASSALPLSTDPVQAAQFIKAYAASATVGATRDYTGKPLPGMFSGDNAIWALLEPHDSKSNIGVLRAAGRAAEFTGKNLHAVIPAPGDRWPQLLGLAEASGCRQAYCLDSRDGRLSRDGRSELIRRLLKPSDGVMLFAGIDWNSALASVAGEAENRNMTIDLYSGVSGIARNSSGGLLFSFPVYEGKLLRLQEFKTGSAFITIASEADFPAQARKQDFLASVLDLAIDPGWITPLPPVLPPTLSLADVVIDLGYGVKDSAGLKLAQELKKKLEELGLSPLFGATRKVTQDLKLLPLETQIGQTGVRVNPKLVIALGISGAPQHIDYVGNRAEILCFNKDSEAPLMKLNQGKPAPRVHPILGDLFVTVRELIDRL